MNQKIKAVAVLAALMSASVGAHAQTVIYNFTGTVLDSMTTGSDAAIPVGTVVRGTYTFDYTNAIPSQGSGTIGTAPFTIEAWGGGIQSLPLPSGFVFSSTAKVTKFPAYAYSTRPVQAYDTYSVAFADDANHFNADEETSDGVSTVASSNIVLYNLDSTPFSSLGYAIGFPAATAVVYGTGTYRFQSATTTYGVDYNITSLTLASAPPVVGPVITGTLGTNGWYISKPTMLKWIVLAKPAATESGCGAVNVPDTTGTTYTCSATNSLGNASQSITIKKDTVAPAVAVKKPANGATYTAGQTVLASYTCTDATSGVASCVGTVPVGAAIDTSASNSFTVTATDNAGNVTTKSVSYTVN